MAQPPLPDADVPGRSGPGYLPGRGLGDNPDRAGRCGGRVRARASETERFRHTRRWLRAGVTVALPRGFTVGGSGQLGWTDYQGNWSPFTPGGAPRADRTRSLRLSVHNRAFTLQGFSPQLSLVNEVRTSNAQLHDYKRTGGELRFVRQF